MTTSPLVTARIVTSAFVLILGADTPVASDVADEAVPVVVPPCADVDVPLAALVLLAQTLCAVLLSSPGAVSDPSY
jgi:hypothetical protein